jgi:hypothetical protein
VNNQPANRFPKAASISLAFLFIAIAVLAGHGETQATLAADPDPLSGPNAAAELVWVRQDPPIINVNNDPTYWEATEPRFDGSFGEHTLAETEFTYHERYVDHGYEWYDVTLKTVFDLPPRILTPADSYEVRAVSSHSGTHNEGSIGMQFWYSSPYGAVIEPHEVLGYYPFDAWWDGTSSKEWAINPPAILGEGDSFEMYASWWNCPPCNVTWTYKAEPADSVPRLGVEVMQPIVKYQGKEIPPGETYFPEPCPITTTRSAEACDDHILEYKAKVALICRAGDKAKRLLILLQLLDLAHEKIEFSVLQIRHRLSKHCGYSDLFQLEQNDEFQLDLVLEEGAVQLHNEISTQTVSIDTPLGAAYSASQGTFMAGYSSAHNSALFRAYSTPLLLEPKSGSTLVIKPNQEVELTAEGFGPVTDLPHLYLPMLTR